ncbi:MAG: hypothetical protein M1837_007306 [Sclerophora amabilis]|nr:MAG: hypothetical protein M1837_007306 [Sclerophora amabilis]
MSSAALSAEVSPSPSRGFLSKARRKKGKLPGSSTASIISNEGSSGSHQGGLRSSIDSAIDKIRTGPDGSRDRQSEGPKGIQGLIGRQRSKRARRKKKQKDESTSEEVDRGRSVAERGTLEDSLEPHGRSPSSFTEDTGRSESSMITVESDEEPLNPPALVSRPSHAGYLTLSSPLIQKPLEHNSDGLDPQSLTPVKTDNTPAVAPASTSDLRETPKLTPRHAATIQSASSSSRSRSPRSPSDKHVNHDRTFSPIEKLRDGIGGFLGPQFDGEGLESPRGSSASRRSSKVTEIEAPKTISPGGEGFIRRPQSAKGALPSQRINTAPTASGSALTPVTTITPPTPTDLGSTFPPASPATPKSADISTTTDVNPNVVTSASGHMISHRRVRSASSTAQPSKLSNAQPAPLTPTIEEPRSVASTPGSSGLPGQGTFFSSVFSAASNAATTLSNSISNNSLSSSNRSRSGTQSSDKNLTRQGAEDTGKTDFRPSSSGARETADGGIRDQRPLAVETLGSGSLSLSHLGILTDPVSLKTNQSMASSPGGAAVPGSSADVAGMDHGSTSVGRHAAAGTASISPGPEVGADDASRVDTGASRASSAAPDLPLEGSAGGATNTQLAEDVASSKKSQSLYESSLPGDQTPPNGRDWDLDGGIRRSGSVRSRVDPVARRKRGGSTATGTTIATALGSTNNTVLANAAAAGSVPRLTGFAVASKKRNRDFHQLFRSVPEDDYLIEDYSAAIQREILLHGRFYVSEGHICFNSNIFGYVTTLVISFDEVVSVEKKSTAMLFPNAIVIQTLHARNIFASFASRDSTYDLLVGIWKISHPNLRSSLNGVQLDEAGGGDKTVVGDASPESEDESDEFDEQEEVYDEDEEDEAGLGSFTEAGDGSIAGSDVGDVLPKTASRKASAAMLSSPGITNGVVPNGDFKTDKAAAIAASAVDYPGPTTHAPTECGDQDTHFERLIKDETIPAPLGKVYSMIFGATSGVFMTKWLLDDQKVLELEMEDDKKGLSNEKRSRAYSYIRPLNGSIGPRQTKCIITESLDAIDLEKAVSVTVVTQTPDVPSGNAFNVKTRYCLTWAPGNGTRVLVNCTIEWTGKSWLKGPIEKGANDGQITYAGDLAAAIKATLTAKSISMAGGTKKNARRRRKDVADPAANALARSKARVGAPGTSRSPQQQQSWGLLEPLRDPLSPFVDLFKPLMTSQVGLVIMAFLVAVLWMRQSYGPGSARVPGDLSLSGLTTPERIAAYEEIWRREESQLWDWLEERIELDGLALGGEAGRSGRGSSSRTAQRQSSRQVGGEKGAGVNAGQSGSQSPAAAAAKLAQQKMSEREMNEAIRVTQSRLDMLKEMVERGKENEKGRHDEGYHQPESQEPV